MSARNLGRPLIFITTSLSALSGLVCAAAWTLPGPDWRSRADDGTPAVLVESRIFAVKLPDVLAFDPDGGGYAHFAFGTPCRLLGPEPPESAVVEIAGRPWRVHRSCVRVVPSN